MSFDHDIATVITEEGDEHYEVVAALLRRSGVHYATADLVREMEAAFLAREVNRWGFMAKFALAELFQRRPIAVSPIHAGGRFCEAASSPGLGKQRDEQ